MNIPMTEDDLTYIQANYVSLPELVADRAESVEEARALVQARKLPAAPYVLPDGTEMFPRDWFVLADESGGVDRVRSEFERRFRAAADRAGEPASEETVAGEWKAYLGGLYAVCLRQVTPENIFVKEHLVQRLTELLASPRPEDVNWRMRLRTDVDALDRLERPFAPCDRLRLGGSVTRDRLITDVRARYPECFARGGGGASVVAPA